MSINMKIKEFKGIIHMPNKLKQVIRNGIEIPQMLPPRNAMSAYAVDSYPACPDSWMNGSDIASSYFVGVEEDKGMWLDFNPCHNLEYEVAVVISIQGVNPITGQKTDKLRLEKYRKKCPVHDVAFQQDNYCPKCEFNWPDQNYLATTGTPVGSFWLDGFRRPDGTVRQYIFTAEEMKGIASQVIGKDKVYAIGIAFYYSKEKKPIREIHSGGRAGSSPIGQSINPSDYPDWTKINHQYFPGNHWKTTPSTLNYYTTLRSGALGPNSPAITGSNKTVSVDSFETDDCIFGVEVGDGDSLDMDMSNHLGCAVGASASVEPRATSAGLNQRKGISNKKKRFCQSAGKDKVVSQGMVVNSVKRPSIPVQKVTPVKKLEIGAGALIKQRVYRDPKEMDFWSDEPAGMLYVNYCDMETLAKILKAGEIGKKPEGFMQGLAVGD